MSIAFLYPHYLWLLLLVPLTVWLGLYARRSQTPWRRFGELGLRSVLLTAIVLALAGIQVRWNSNLLTTVFVLDVSDSISPEEQQAGEALIRQAVGSMGTNDQAAVIIFGQDALVERMPSGESILAGVASVPVSTRTDIASALQLSQAILPGEGAKRIVLLSDGRENLGYAVEQAELAAAQGIQLLYQPLSGPQGQAEVLVQNLEAPAETRLGQEINLTAVISSTLAVDATVRLFEDGDLVQSKELVLQRGRNQVEFSLPAANADNREDRFRRFRVQVVPEFDTRLQNNEYGAFTVVYGPPHILLLEGGPGEGENLAAALEKAEMNVTRLPPSQMPTTLSELAGYEAVILVNVKASELPPAAMESLPVYVRNLGQGLLMVGGAQAYGAGGYLRTPLEEALPVDMDVKDREMQANLALVLAVDKSGSMGRCHCDNPDLNQSYTRSETGQPKVDIAKEAIMRAASALGNQDYLGVVAFDDRGRWTLPVAQLPDPAAIENAIGSFQANGPTNLQAGVGAAYEALQGVDAKRKHIILMTDGWVRTGDLSQKAMEMKAQGITLSVVAAGEGSAEYLKAIAELGGGRYYPATDILNVPDIFLKETIFSAGQYIIEEPTLALASDFSPALAGLDATRLPMLAGYNGSTPKSTARRELLAGPRGDPLLATWQYGLGRSAAWTSDFKGQWASEWVAWDGFPRFAAQLVNWLLPAPQSEGLSAEVREEGGQAVIRLQAVDASGQPLNFLTGAATFVGPDLSVIEASLEQVGAGEYRAAAPLSAPGAYLVRLGVNQGDQSMGQVTRGLVVTYSEEYRASGENLSLLGRLAEITGGGFLFNEQGELLAFTRQGLPSAEQAREIGWYLLLVTALLFPLDVAVRRLILTRRDLQMAQAWVQERLLRRPMADTTQATGPQLLGNLFQARQRARHRQIDAQENQPGAGEMPAAPPLPSKPLPAEPRPTRPPKTPEGPPPEAPTQETGDSLARLRQAKKRARRE